MKLETSPWKTKTVLSRNLRYRIEGQALEEIDLNSDFQFKHYLQCSVFDRK